MFSIEVLANIEAQYPEIKIINQKNSGVAKARNTGIGVASGRYIVCLDADDVLDPTYIEKMAIVLESKQHLALVTTDMQIFGVDNRIYKQADYNPIELINDNMVVTAAMYRKSAWQKTRGYTSDLGYEDWEFWIQLAESGYWGIKLSEPLFKYRTALSSRYIDDKSKHKTNYSKIKSLHPTYDVKVRKLIRAERKIKYSTTPASVFINLNRQADYRIAYKPGVMIFMPWMTFGGAETLVNNFTKEVKENYDITFVTGLKSENEWEYKFKDVSEKIYHLANMFEQDSLKIEFISNYITTRNIRVLHLVHNGYMFDMLGELKKRHPKLKVVLTMFNDRVEYFEQSVNFSDYIDIYTSDNLKVQKHYNKLLKHKKDTLRIPNGIDSTEKFNPDKYNHNLQKELLGIDAEKTAVFFIGRLSSEKNPDVFVDTARRTQNLNDIVHYYVIGDGPMRPEIEQDIKQLPNITYLGYQEDIPGYLSTADIFVLPSSIEGFPLSLLEAMAMRVVSVASDVGAVADVVTDTRDGFVVTPGSSNEIEAVIRSLLKDKKNMVSIKNAARKTVVSRYSNIILGKNYKKLYNSLLK